MPELPEVEIAARRLNTALSGASVDSAVAPGMNVMKTFDPPLEALEGRKVTGVRRVGKMPVVEFGDLALLIHLMSAGRLKVFEKRASLKDRASRVLVRLDDGRELRLREFGTKQRAWAKLLAADAVAEDEMVPQGANGRSRAEGSPSLPPAEVRSREGRVPLRRRLWVKPPYASVPATTYGLRRRGTRPSLTPAL